MLHQQQALQEQQRPRACPGGQGSTCSAGPHRVPGGPVWAHSLVTVSPPHPQLFGQELGDGASPPRLFRQELGDGDSAPPIAPPTQLFGQGARRGTTD